MHSFLAPENGTASIIHTQVIQGQAKGSNSLNSGVFLFSDFREKTWNWAQEKALWYEGHSTLIHWVLIQVRVEYSGKSKYIIYYYIYYILFAVFFFCRVENIFLFYLRNQTTWRSKSSKGKNLHYQGVIQKQTNKKKNQTWYW